jgi:hypothetical protein
MIGRYNPEKPTIINCLIEIMGESKRRKEILGDEYGQEQNIVSWLPVKKSQAEQFVKWSTRGAWAGIIFMVLYWVTVRFVGPIFGWWQVVN